MSSVPIPTPDRFQRHHLRSVRYLCTNQTALRLWLLCEYDFRRGNIDPTVDRDLRAVLGGEKFFSEEGSCLRGGNAEGTLVGGNLSTLSDLNGTPYYPDIRDSIILIEDEVENLTK